MKKDPAYESQWRIDAAIKLSEYYSSHPEVKMIVLGGSPSRGLSDLYSDLDIVIYWDKMDMEFLEGMPLRSLNSNRTMLQKMGQADIYLEEYYFKNLKVDFGHTSLRLWEEWTDRILKKHEPDQNLIKSLGGFLDSIALHGQTLVDEWKKVISDYPDELAQNVIRRHLRFYMPGSLHNQGWKRNDILFYYDGICMMLKNLLAVLSGINKVYFSIAEPRWIQYELSRMPVKPVDCVEKINSIINAEGPQAAEILENLTEEILSLVEEHVPQIDLTRIRKFRKFKVNPVETNPFL